MRWPLVSWSYAAVAALATMPAARAAESIDYERDVKPILKASCYPCHGSLKQEGGLRLDTAKSLIGGGDSGPAVEPGSAEDSYLMTRLHDEDESLRMPQEAAALKAAAIATIAAWIDQGAAAPADEQPEADPRDHWAFKKPVRPAVPAASDSALAVRTPIDAFIGAKLREKGLQAAGDAPRSALLRRVYLDLIGLPPSREELHAFLADESPDAYEQVVDRLLASPQYGERWGRHWMDVWRYSDWYGRRSVPDVMNSYPTIWRWRDWIVRSLNEDKGYDRMVVEMLAADEVAPADDDAIVATGFLVRNWFKWNYNQWMKDNVEHTGKAFLGLTFNCAHCHDHKYDPISHREYFAMRAFFEPLELRQDRVPGEPDPGPYKEYVYTQTYGPIAGGMIRVFDKKLDAATRMYSRGDERNVIEGEEPVEPGLPAILGLAPMEVEPVELPPVAAYPGLKPFIVEEELAKARGAVAAAQPRLDEANAALAAQEPELIAAVEQAQGELDEVRARLARTKPNALTGRRSLFVDALQGRQAMSHLVSAVGHVRDGTVFSFQVMLEADAHANLQLARDPATGLTATFIGFEQGRILTYAPGSFNYMEIGQYDLSSGQNRFQVTCTLDVTNDSIAVTVTNLDGGAVIVDGAVGALNGWNPGAHPHQGILFDVRPGTAVAFDEIIFRHPGEEPVVHLDFEEAEDSNGGDAPDAAPTGWTASSFSVAPAIALVNGFSMSTGEYAAARQKRNVARRRLDALRLAATAAEAAAAAAPPQLAALEARIAAGEAKFNDAADAADLAREAALAERRVAHAQAVAAERAAEHALAELEAKPGTAEEIAAATAARHAAVQATAAAAAAAADGDQFALLTPTYPEKSTGRRTMLARQIASRDNPLTARVAVNHLWTRHFGEPLVESVFDFGRNGKAPSHPELLDWLAVEFMESGWSMKHLHRLMALSSAYRMDTRFASESNARLDPDNKLYWRFHRTRMESEAVRDSMLHAAGLLEATMGGPEIELQNAPASRRRSLYLSHQGEQRASMMETFDGADPNECYRRSESVVPQQALALANGDLAVESSRVLARRLWAQVVSGPVSENEREEAFVSALFEQLLSRTPKAAERAAALALLAEQTAVYRSIAVPEDAETEQPTEPAVGDGARPSLDPAMRARESLAHALLSHHDFISIR